MSYQMRKPHLAGQSWEDRSDELRGKAISSTSKIVKLNAALALFVLLVLSSVHAASVQAKPFAQAMASASATVGPSQSDSSPVEFVWKTPSHALSFPKHLVADDQGNVYVADEGKDRIQKFDRDGKFLTMWGSTGSGDGQFVFLCSPDCPPLCPPPPPDWSRCNHLPSGGVALDRQGHVLVADYNGRIQKFDSSGRFLAKWGSKGSADGQFDSPYDLAVDGQDNIYVTDIFLNRVQKFDSNGKFLTKWGTAGSGDGQFNQVCDIAVDGQGNVYVVDLRNNRVQKFDSNGKFLTKWGTAGHGDGQFDVPEGVAVDRQGHVYVTDNVNHRIQIFDSEGKFLTKWGSAGSGDGQFSYVRAVTVDREGNIYASDDAFGDDRVQKFRPVSQPLTARPATQTPAAGTQQACTEVSIAVSADTSNILTEYSITVIAS